MLPVAAGPGRRRFVINGKDMTVEAAAKEYLRTLGWWVVPGQEASLFFAVMSSNFHDSFFASVLANYVGPETPAMVERLDRLCEEAARDGRLAPEHLTAAADLLCKYYSSDGDHRRFRRLAAEVGTLAPVDQLGLLKVYKHIGYFTKGIPDLFAIRPGAFRFSEVKSAGDAVRPEQYFFAEALLRETGDGFQVIRILDSSRDHKAALANPADISRARGASYESRETATGLRP
jgi:hypothetical protein